MAALESVAFSVRVRAPIGTPLYIVFPLHMGYSYLMPYEEVPKVENEQNQERIPSREEIVSELHNRCEEFEVERELADTEGVYLLEVMSSDKSKRYTYQRKGLFTGKIESAGTTIRSEDMDDGYSRTIADYDPITGNWVDQ